MHPNTQVLRFIISFPCMQDFVPGVLIIFYVYIVVVTSSLMINIGESQRIFNVVDYGAVGDGQTDDSPVIFF